MSALEDLMRGRGGQVAPETPAPKKTATKKAPKEREELPPTTESRKVLRKISEPGIYDLTEEEYHSDPCPEPSLSASIAKKIVGQSPAHARHAHPRLNPAFAREEKEIFDRGTVAHALLLQGIERAEIIAEAVDAKGVRRDIDDWKLADAKRQRDEARAAGKIPILEKHWATVQQMIERCREQIAQHKEASDAFTEGKPEQTIIWREDNGVWCRAKLDWLHDSRLKIDDYKSTGRDVDPESIGRNAVDNLEIQEAFYRRGIKALTGNDPAFRFVCQENVEPYAVSVIGFGPDFQWMGDAKVEYAIRIFGKCLKSGRWPGYPDRICYPMLPKWAEEAWERMEGTR